MLSRTTRSTPIAALLGLGALLLLAGCSTTAGAAQKGATCDEFTNAAGHAVAQTAEAKVGDQLSVVLCSNPSTGYSWGIPTVADPSVATIGTATYREPGASLPIVGGAGGQEILVTAAKAGTTTIHLSYGQPWDGGQKDAWTYDLTLTVK